MNKRLPLLVFFGCLLVAVGAGAARHLHFDFGSLRTQLRSVSLWRVIAGAAFIHAGFCVRAVRWKVLLGTTSHVSANALVAPQFIGFSAVALFGRLADLTRPYLIAKRTGLPVAAQVAVYSVERIFDLAAAAILFSLALAFAPRGLPHHEAFARAGFVSLAGTTLLAAFAVTIRFAGDRLSTLVFALFSPSFPGFAQAAAERIADFRTGFDTLRSMRQLAAALGLSMALWLGIAAAYVEATRAFVSTPQLAGLSYTQTMLLMATSMGGSLLQLPVLGWFTQIGLLAAAMHVLFGVPPEAATACGAVLLFVTTLCIVPAGLLAARVTGTTLRPEA